MSVVKQEKVTKHATDNDFQKLNLWAIIRNLNDDRGGQSPEKSSNKKENKKSIDSGKQDIPVAAEEKPEKEAIQMVDFKPITQNPK